MHYPTFKFRNQYFVFVGSQLDSRAPQRAADLKKVLKHWDSSIPLRDGEFMIVDVRTDRASPSKRRGGYARGASKTKSKVEAAVETQEPEPGREREPEPEPEREPESERESDRDQELDFESQFNSEDIDDLLSADVKLPVDSESESVSQQRGPTKRVFAAVNIVTFPMIYHFDNVLELKQKFAYVIGEPMFKLHFMYTSFGVTQMMSYKVHIGIQPLPINLPSFLADKELEQIQRVPVNLKLSSYAEFTQIKTFDITTIFDQLRQQTTHFEVVHLDDHLVDPSGLRSLSSNEIHLIYEGFVKFFWPMLSSINIFKEYILDPVAFLNQYPNIGSPHLESIFREEDKIIRDISMIGDSDLKYMNKNQFTSILSLIIQFNSYMFSDNPIVNLRSLFDTVKLDDHMVAMKCHLMLDTQYVVLQKAFKQWKFIDNMIPRNSCVMRYYIDPMRFEFLDLYIFANGNINVRVRLSREKNYTFQSILDMAIKHINPIIRHLNTFGDRILYNNLRLTEITREYVKFTNITMEIIYHQPEGRQLNRNVLVNTLQQLSKARMIILQSLDDRLTFFLQKGTFVYNMDKIEKNMIIQNYYSFLTNSEIYYKWVVFFYKQRKTQVTLQHNNISFSISGLQEDEYGYIMTFLNYVMHRLLYPAQYPELKALDKEPATPTRTSSIRQLKQFDPVLFDYNKVYRMSGLFSTACQGEHQPIAKTPAEYELMSESEKAKFSKYWNFTTQTPAYYGCPHKSNPHLYYLPNKHSLGLCLPCCRKTMIKNILEDEVNRSCSEHFRFDKTKTNKIKDTRYIMNFGKMIPPGRLCKLPPDLENLFNYYTQDDHTVVVMGVEQKTFGVQSAIINIASICLEIPSRVLLSSIHKTFLNRSKVFYSLLNGSIIQYFSTPTAFATALKELATQDEPLTYVDDVPWNMIFIDLLFYCNEVNVVLFSQDMRRMDTPTRFHTFNRHSSEYKQSIIVIQQTFDHAVTCSLICELNLSVFFSTRLITTKLVAPDYQLYKPILSMITHFESMEQDAVQSSSPKSLGLSSIYKRLGKSWTLVKLFANKTDLIYYIGVRRTGTTEIVYIPTYNSEILSSIDKKSVEVIYAPFDVTAQASRLEQVGAFLADTGFELDIEYAITHPGPSTIIGFVLRGIMFYHKKCDPATFRRVLKLRQDVKLVPQAYDPNMINQALFKAAGPKYDRRSSDFARDFYSVYMYQVFILEFVIVIHRQNNKKLRAKILGVIEQTKNGEQAYTAIVEALQAYYSDRFPEWETYYDEDRLKIIQQFMNSRTQDLGMIIETTLYNFDQVILHDLFALSDPKDQFKYLDRLAREFVDVVSASKYDQHFKTSKSVVVDAPNILLTCAIDNPKDNPNSYCTDRHRLIVTTDQLRQVLELFVRDINNSLKRRWLFNILFVRDHINNYKFIQRKHESIAINLE